MSKRGIGLVKSAKCLQLLFLVYCFIFTPPSCKSNTESIQSLENICSQVTSILFHWGWIKVLDSRCTKPVQSWTQHYSESGFHNTLSQEFWIVFVYGYFCNIAKWVKKKKKVPTIKILLQDILRTWLVPSTRFRSQLWIKPFFAKVSLMVWTSISLRSCLTSPYWKTNGRKKVDENRRLWLLVTSLCQDALVAHNKDEAAARGFVVLTDAEPFPLFVFLSCRHIAQTDIVWALRAANSEPPWNLFLLS